MTLVLRMRLLALTLASVALGCSGGEGNRSGDAGTTGSTSGSGGSDASTTGSTSSSNTGGTSDTTSNGSTETTSTSSSTSSSSGSGGGSSGGSTTGGGGSGGGGLGNAECRTVADCMVDDEFGASDTRCAAPYEPSGNTTVCGAVDWCGECACPIQAPRPEGLNQSCETNDDCVAWGDTPNAASCVDGLCVVCTTDEDCSSELPHCSFQTGFNYIDTCVECTFDEHCGADLPRCVYVDNVGPSCVECVSNTDCEIGVCSQNSCVPGCTSDDDCPNPATGCGENARCGPIPCTSGDECPDNTSCSDQVCYRRSCSSDADCEGVCVNGQCHERYGTCSTTYYAP